MRVRAADARHDKVGMCQVEARIEPQGHDGRGSAGVTDTGDDAEDALLAIHSQSSIAGREGKRLVQVLALHPVLKLAGGVAGVGADLKHRHHNRADLDRLRCFGERTLAGAPASEGAQQEEQGKETHRPDGSAHSPLRRPCASAPR